MPNLRNNGVLTRALARAGVSFNEEDRTGGTNLGGNGLAVVDANVTGIFPPTDFGVQNGGDTHVAAEGILCEAGSHSEII